MKKIIAILFTILFLFSFVTVGASAADEIPFSVVSAYYKNGQMYGFLNIENDSDVKKGRFNIINDKYIGEIDSKPVKLTDTDLQVNYMFLIDTSDSMPYYKDQITSLANALLNNEKNPINVTICTFGEKFSLIDSGLTDIASITKVVDGLNYTQRTTDICGGLIDAFDFISSHVMDPGEIWNIILVTDGVPYLSDYGNNETELKDASDELKGKITKTPEVVVHSVCFTEWEYYTYDAVSQGKGLHEKVKSNFTAEEAGESIAQFTDALYRINVPYEIDLYDARIDADLICLDTYDTVAVKNVRNFDQSGVIFLEIDPDGIANNSGSKNSKDSEEFTESTVSSTPDEATIDEATSDGAIINKNDKIDGINWLVIALIVLVLLAVALVVIILSRKRKGSNESANDDHSIIVKLQICEGDCPADRLEFKLKDELIIGNAQECDITFDDVSMELKNTRVYLEDGIVYIENIGDVQNTYLEGMKLFSSNRLRSGDEISIGDTRFKLLF